MKRKIMPTLGLLLALVLFLSLSPGTIETFGKMITREENPIAEELKLKSLSINPGALTPAFDPDEFEYEVLVGNSVSSITIAAVANDPNAFVICGGFGIGEHSEIIPLDLNEDRFELEVIVALEEEEFKEYSIVVMRQADGAGLKLLNLSINTDTSPVMLDPSFDPDALDYTASITYEDNSITVAAVASDPNAFVAFSMGGIGIGEHSELIPLDLNENQFYLEVIIASDVDSKTYTITINRQAGLGYGPNGKFLALIEAPDPNAIKIYTTQDLDNVRNNLVGNYVLMNNIDLADWGGGQWLPIGDNSTNSNNSRFTGTFDGQGYVIKNMSITGDACQYVGLFGYISGAIIKNTGLEDAYVNASYPTPFYTGGICGYSAGSITNCYNTGDILSSSYSSVSYSFYAGGICGYSNSAISYCYNTGDISSSPSSYAYSFFAGGICGYCSSSISNCYNTGDISSFSSFNIYAGGICGYCSRSINSCYNTGDISSYSYASSSPNMVYAGGICGSGPIDSSILGSISNCFNSGDISSSSFSPYSYTHAGGIYGYGSFISNCYNTGDISSVAPSIPYAGGISSYIFSSTSNCVTLSSQIYAENTGTISYVYSYLIGYSYDETKTNNLALEGITGNPINDANGRITLAKAKEQTTYEELSWDFESIWRMVPGYMYPQLHGLPLTGPELFHIVTFVDWDGTILKTESVAHGFSVAAPSTPEREGYTFIGWDKDFSAIISDLIITALYEPKYGNKPEGSITMEANAKGARIGQEYLYLITLTNSATATDVWKNVIATDTLPYEVDYVSYRIIDDSGISVGGSVSVAEIGGTVTIDCRDIAVGGKVIVEIKVKVNESAKVGHRVCNSVTAMSVNDDDKDDDEDWPEIVANPDGSIEKAANVEEIRIGHEFSYTLTLHNSELAVEAWKNVLVTDELHAELDFVSATVIEGSGASRLVKIENSGQIVTIDCGDIAIKGTVVVEITVKVNDKAVDGTKIENTAIAESSNDDPKKDTDDKPLVKKAPDGGIKKEADATVVQIDDLFKYMLSVENTAKAVEPWKDVVVSDTLPGYLDYVDGSGKVINESGASIPVVVNHAGGIVSFSCGDIEIGGIVIVEFMVKVNDTAAALIGKQIENTAIAESSNDDPKQDTDETPLLKSKADGKITKVTNLVANPDTGEYVVRVGEEYSYLITLTNDAAATEDWKDVIATDVIPDELDLVTSSLVSGTINGITTVGKTVTIDCGDIAAGDSVVVRITVKVNTAAVVGANIVNTVIAKSSNEEDKKGEDDKPLVKNDPDGRITKTATQAIVHIGEEITYTLSLKNDDTAKDNWKDVEASDVLPDYLDYVVGSGKVLDESGASIPVIVNHAGGVVSFSCGNIRIGGVVVVEFKVKVNAKAKPLIGKNLENSAIAISRNDEFKYAKDETPLLKTGADGRVTKVADIAANPITSEQEIRLGDVYSYLFTIENLDTATEAWKNVVATDVLPTCLDYVSSMVISENGSSKPVEIIENYGVVTIDCGDIAPGGKVVVEIAVRLNASATVMVGNYVKNTVVAKSDNDKDKEDADEKPLFKRNPDASITKVANAGALYRGEEFSYTLTLTNSDKATGAWRNVIVTDILPADLDYVSGSSTQGSVWIGADGKTVTVTVGDIAIGATVTVEIKVIVNNSAVVGAGIVNTAIAKSDNEEDKIDTDTKPLIAPNGSVTKVASETKVNVGDEYFYTITLENAVTAIENWKSVIATDVLPLEVDYVSFRIVDGSGGSSVSVDGTVAGTVTIKCGDIAIGGKVTVEVKVKLNNLAAEKVGERICNRVIAKSDNDEDKEVTDDRPLINGSSEYKPLYIKEATGNIGTVGSVVIEMPYDSEFLDKYALVCDEDIEVEIYFSPQRTNYSLSAFNNIYIFAVRLPNGETREDLSFSFKPIGGGIEKNKNIIYGDVNEDGYVTTTDATLVTRWAGGNTAAPLRNILAADVNGDAYITTTDATLITRRAGGNPAAVFSIETKVGLIIRLKGDINGDGMVSVEDAMMLMQMLAGSIPMPNDPIFRAIADVNGDGVIDSADADLIIRMVVDD